MTGQPGHWHERRDVTLLGSEISGLNCGDAIQTAVAMDAFVVAANPSGAGKVAALDREQWERPVTLPIDRVVGDRQCAAAALTRFIRHTPQASTACSRRRIGLSAEGQGRRLPGLSLGWCRRRRPRQRHHAEFLIDVQPAAPRMYDFHDQSSASSLSSPSIIFIPTGRPRR